MPLPLAPLVSVVLRIGMVATTTYALARWVQQRTYLGRTDQRAEDAFDALGEGLSLHRPADRASDVDSQTNATARMRRVIRVGGRTWELDAGLMARFRLRQSKE